MSTLLPQLDDSLLPAEAAWSFIFAYEDVRGRGATHGALAIAGQRVMPDTWRTWIDPLSSYVIYGKETAFMALPYSHLALLAYAVTIEWADRPRQIEAITRDIGRHWWSGTNVIRRSKPFVNVQMQLGSIIQRRMYEHRQSHQNAKSAADANRYELTALAIQACVTTLSDWSSISCYSIQSPSAVRVDILRCPFCLYEQVIAGSFLGLIDGILDWLDTAIDNVKMPGRLEVNLSQSLGHTIILDWNAAAQMVSRDYG